MTASNPIETDALIIGAGPVGLFQAFQLGLLDIRAHIVDALPYAGGQCIELYPDKPIYDIPGTPRSTGRELVANLLQQLAPFAPPMHLGQHITAIQDMVEGRFTVQSSTGAVFFTKTLILAAGVGAFLPKLLRVDGLDQFVGEQVFYHIRQPERFADQRLLIVGGDDTAVRWAVHFASGACPARSVTLLHRRDVLTAESALLAEFERLRSAGDLAFQVGQVTGCTHESGLLTEALVTDVDGQTCAVPLDALLVFQGLSPQLGPITDWGLDMERKQLKVDTERFSTSRKGIFAVGDVNTYPGKKKLILSGFHESALAAFGVAELVFPGRKTLLQYTTTSSHLHQLLGVD